MGEHAAQIGRTIAESTPFWPAERRIEGAPNVLVMMLDDVGFADFGCYGSEIDTPNLDALAARGLRYTSFHTTAMCSTTRAALHTGHNHHAVGMGCLANFDSGYPGYRGNRMHGQGCPPCRSDIAVTEISDLRPKEPQASVQVRPHFDFSLPSARRVSD